MGRKPKAKRFVISYIKDDQDRLLMGKRHDSGKWTCSAGGVYPKECVWSGVVRELKEETGLDAQEVKLLKIISKNNNLIYLFKVIVDKDQKIDPSNDPDKEASIWEYKDPIDVINDLHIPSEENIAIQYWIKE